MQIWPLWHWSISRDGTKTTVFQREATEFPNKGFFSFLIRLIFLNFFAYKFNRVICCECRLRMVQSMESINLVVGRCISSVFTVGFALLGNCKVPSNFSFSICLNVYILIIIPSMHNAFAWTVWANGLNQLNKEHSHHAFAVPNQCGVTGGGEWWY